MPGYNQQGPTGNGPMTGRKMGRCTNYGGNGNNGKTGATEVNSQANPGFLRRCLRRAFNCRAFNGGGNGAGNGAGRGSGRGLRNGGGAGQGAGNGAGRGAGNGR